MTFTFSLFQTGKPSYPQPDDGALQSSLETFRPHTEKFPIIKCLIGFKMQLCLHCVNVLTRTHTHAHTCMPVLCFLCMGIQAAAAHATLATVSPATPPHSPAPSHPQTHTHTHLPLLWGALESCHSLPVGGVEGRKKFFSPLRGSIVRCLSITNKTKTPTAAIAAASH